ncbi:MAG: hypothetical protein MJ002_05650 [Paludibacteraceae bacterium]|nr:hypothetical protein [Paludibacteraceae bacterium]
MKQKRIDGISIISENGDFFFDSGLPESEPVIPNPSKHRGTATLQQNGSIRFKAAKVSPVGTPPLNTILRTPGLYVKRSSRNFIVTMKFPIFENESETSSLHDDFWNQAEPAILEERNKIKKTF